MYIFFKIEGQTNCIHYDNSDQAQSFVQNNAGSFAVQDADVDALKIPINLLSVNFDAKTIGVDSDAVAKKDLEIKAAEAQSFLRETDFYFTVDKYATLSEERKAELTQKRAEARAVVNAAE